MSSQGNHPIHSAIRANRVFLLAGAPLILVGLSAILFLYLKADTAGLAAVQNIVRRSFPGAPQLSTDELATWLADTNRPTPILLDVRSSEEYEWSHLAGAQRVEPGSSVAEVSEFVETGAPMVLYCAVGYRSSELAQLIAQSGNTNVYNLDGAIYKWANEGRPLVSASGMATTVQPYGTSNARLLKGPYRAPKNP